MERAPKNPNSSASIRLALLAAQRAGVIEDQPLRILGEDELERRIDGSASHDAIAPMANPAMPSILGYEFVREINHGGQATVYEAIQQRTQRRVAVKVIPGGPYISSRNRARFEREAKALAAVDHANVVKILDLGRTTDGSFFLVMDYIKGPCLDGQIADWRADRFEPQRVLVVFSKIARALEAVHRSGIVHRDLKPSNVLIDSQGEPHVVDFGLAKALQEPDGPHTYTLTGQIIGSLAWASPEQAAGGSATLDVRSDVYTLGVMLHEALTGSFPYAVDGTISEILENIQRAIPKRASRMIRRWGGLDARGVDAMLFKALAKAPCDRYATAADLADDLDRLLARRPTSEHLKSKSRFVWGNIAFICGGGYGDCSPKNTRGRASHGLSLA
jgi:serine/threonine protein kinase